MRIPLPSPVLMDRAKAAMADQLNQQDTGQVIDGRPVRGYTPNGKPIFMYASDMTPIIGYDADNLPIRWGAINDVGSKPIASSLPSSLQSTLPSTSVSSTDPLNSPINLTLSFPSTLGPALLGTAPRSDYQELDNSPVVDPLDLSAPSALLGSSPSITSYYNPRSVAPPPDNPFAAPIALPPSESTVARSSGSDSDVTQATWFPKVSLSDVRDMVLWTNWEGDH